MQRDATKQLEEWRRSSLPKPLVLEGARQVGKTWLVSDFGERSFERFVRVDFEDRRDLQHLFEPDFDEKRILRTLRIATGTSIEPGRTLLFLDEIQQANRGVTALKYLRERCPGLHIVAAGSLLGVAMHRGESFPVGQVDFLRLFPLSFREFLRACGHRELADAVAAREWDVLAPFEARLNDLLRNYLYVGGMPEAVASFARNDDLTAVRKVQSNLLAAYGNDFSKHIPPHLLARVRLVWNGLPGELAKENRKFRYADLKTGGRSKDFEEAIDWLSAAGLVRRVRRVAKPALPLAAYEEEKAFKLFGLDTGLVAAMAGLRAETVLDGNRIFEEFKGALTEQFAYQQFASRPLERIAYWANERSTAEVDFLLQDEGRIVPVEIKSGDNLRSKSLRFFCETFSPGKAVRASIAPFRDQGWMENVPLWAL